MEKGVNLDKKDFESILSNYNIGKYKKSKYIFTAGKKVFKISTIKGTYILKLYQVSSSKFIKFQFQLLKYLEKSGVPVPKIVSTKKGEDILVYKKKDIEIQEFIRGKEVLYPNRELTKDLGKEIGILDKALLNFKGKIIKDKIDSQEFSKVRIKTLREINLEKESKNILREIDGLDKDKLKKGLIHRDICEGNFLVRDNKVVAIIDWADMGKAFLVQELAVPISHNLCTKRVARRELIKLLLKEYQKAIKLNDEEIKALYLFVKYRSLGSCLWCIEQAFIHKNRYKQLMRWAEHCILRYKAFNKISLPEFLELARG